MSLSSSTWTDCTGFQTNPSNTRITLVSNNRLRDNRWLARPQSNRNQGLVCADKACTQAKKNVLCQDVLDRRKLSRQTSDNVDTWKSKGGKIQRRERNKKEHQRRDRGQKKEDAGARKGKKSRHSVFPMFCGPGGSKSRFAKAAGAEPLGQIRDRKLHHYPSIDGALAWLPPLWCGTNGPRTKRGNPNMYMSAGDIINSDHVDIYC